jgi:SPW repeat
METKRQWQDWVVIILGMWLLLSPFFGLGAVNSAAAWNSYIFGAIVIILSAIAIYESQVWEEWINMAIGIWLIFAPVALGYFHHHDVMLNSVDVGVTIFFFALWASSMRSLKPWYNHSKHSHTG